jgi:hypothetical protein
VFLAQMFEFRLQRGKFLIAQLIRHAPPFPKPI